MQFNLLKPLKHFFVLVVFLTAIQNVHAQSTLSKEEFLKSLDEKMEGWLKEFIVPGAAVVIIEDGKVIHMKGYGFTDPQKKKKVNNNTGFNIGSISKTVAAWGVMKLVEEGKIELDSPAVKYLTRWKFPETEFDERKVTIRGLLSHTAGLSLHGYPGWGPKDTLPTIEESLSGKNNGPGDVRIIVEPGSQWKYSGGGYTVLQLIIEEVTGKPFEQYMQSQVLDPLGMKNSSYRIDDKIMAASSKEFDAYGEEIPFEYFTAKAAAGLHTTIEDFTKFALASIDKTERKDQQVLKSATIELMATPVPVSKGKYGLGYLSMPLPDNKTVLTGHSGANTGWHAVLMLDRASGNGFVMMTNGGSGGHVYRQAMCDWVNWKTGTTLGNACKKPVFPLMMGTIMEKGVDEAIAKYKAIKNNNDNSYISNENMLNSLGYELLNKKKMKEAIAIFKLNVEEYPQSANVYDSLGEAYLKAGDKELAIINYKKSIELNPENQNAIKVLEELK